MTGTHVTSFGQARLWLLSELEDKRTAYNVLIPIRLRGDLDVSALSAALDAVVARHETLRTVYAARDGEPVQIVRDPEPVPLPLVELSTVSVENVFAEAEARPFDLTSGPVLRASLLRP